MYKVIITAFGRLLYPPTVLDDYHAAIEYRNWVVSTWDGPPFGEGVMDIWIKWVPNRPRVGLYENLL